EPADQPQFAGNRMIEQVCEGEPRDLGEKSGAGHDHARRQDALIEFRPPADHRCVPQRPARLAVYFRSSKKIRTSCPPISDVNSPKRSNVAPCDFQPACSGSVTDSLPSVTWISPR